MKNAALISLALIALLSLSSCEKVIDIELDSVDSRLVIEGVLTEGQQEFEVIISQTADYFDPSDPVYIGGAALVLNDDQGNSWELEETTIGHYSVQVNAEAGRVYTLTANVGGQVYTAISEMLSPIMIEELDLEFVESNLFTEEGFSVFVRFFDPGGIQNFYRIKYALNGEVQNSGSDLVIVDDNFFDGSLTMVPLFQQVFQPGDTLELTLIHFDETSYDYWSAIADIASDGGPGTNGSVAAPGNPESNWSEDVLGYFSCQSSDTMQLVIEE